MLEELREKANHLPLLPGVYIMLDAHSEVIYVGKAKKLKNRVSQYFIDSAAHTPKTRLMVSKVDHFDVIIAACRALTIALPQIGLMLGSLDESITAGAHALFMPHGIGHAHGLDAHDMENYGDDVGYAPGTQRSTQFGLNALRLARKLEPGFVLTLEPGCYFIPALIDRWKATHHLAEFICYDELEHYRDCRGIRIEDDILITKNGSRVLGPGISK